MHVRVLGRGENPSPGFVRRPRPVFPEFISHAPWFPVQEWEEDGDGMVILWIPKADNLAYKRVIRDSARGE